MASLDNFCCSVLWNFAKWPAEFGKIFREKLWALAITITNATISRPSICVIDSCFSDDYYFANTVHVIYSDVTSSNI